LIGVVTSGGFSPSLGVPIAMAYVQSKYSDIGSELFASVRNKLVPVTVCEMPFIVQNYYRS
jgi:aminomethyltransferase